MAMDTGIPPSVPRPDGRSRAIGHLSMFAFSALVAFSFTFGGAIADDVDPAVLTAMRFVIAALVMGLVAVAARNGALRLNRHNWQWLAIGGCMAVYFITMFEALRHTTPLATSAVFTMTPLLAAGFGYAVISMRSAPTTLAALLIGAVGALWVVFRGDLDRALAFEIGTGERIFLIGVLAHAAVPALTRRLAPDSTAFEAAFGTVAGALVVTLAYAMPELLATDYAGLPVAVWMVALYLGVVTTAGTFFLLQVAVPRLSPGKVMAYTYLVPSWVVLHSLVLGQGEKGVVYAGGALTLLAMLVLLVSKSD